MRTVLESSHFVRVVGAHDGLTAALIERAGFEAIWAGGLGISAAHGLPDAGLLTMTEILGVAVTLRQATRLPIICDIDGGYGSLDVIRRLVHLYEDAGMAAICLEDSAYPKRNSFRGGHHLEPPETIAEKIHQIVSTRSNKEMLVFARLQSLIAGAGIEDALDRAELYAQAGADAIVIHSRSRTIDEVSSFASAYNSAKSRRPLFTIPTTFYEAQVHQMESIGFAGAIYANQVIRANLRASRLVLDALATTGSTADIEPQIATLKELFNVVDTHLLINDTPWSDLV